MADVQFSFPYLLQRDAFQISQRQVDFNYETSSDEKITTFEEHYLPQFKEFQTKLLQSVVKMDKSELRQLGIETRLVARFEQFFTTLNENKLQLVLIRAEDFKKPAQTEDLADFPRGRVNSMLRVYNVDIDREKNDFLANYMIQREDKTCNIKFLEKQKEQPVKKEAPKSKTISEFQDVVKTVLQKPEEKSNWSKVKSKLYNVMGLKEGTEDIKTPDVMGTVKTLKDSVFSSIRKKDTFILVLEVELFSIDGLAIQEIETQKIVLEEKTEQGLYMHRLRFETAFDPHDAPSIRKAKKFILTDVDNCLHGNPHGKIKNFLPKS